MILKEAVHAVEHAIGIRTGDQQDRTPVQFDRLDQVSLAARQLLNGQHPLLFPLPEQRVVQGSDHKPGICGDFVLLRYRQELAGKLVIVPLQLQRGVILDCTCVCGIAQLHDLSLSRDTGDECEG